MAITILATPLTEAHPASFFMSESSRQQYTKKPLTVEQQLDKMVERGLQVRDRTQAAFYLKHIGYYRLSAYMLPFQRADGSEQHHNFHEGTDFETVLATYTFDRKLRLLVMDALERIEIALKSVIINEMCVPYGSDWYMKHEHFNKHFRHDAFLDTIRKDIDFDKPDEDKRNISIRHFYQRYSKPALPPLWMVFETTSFGTLSLVLSNLHQADKKRITDTFSIGVPVFVSWIKAASYVRNLCAHHSRIWNRVFTIKPMKPKLENPDGLDEDFSVNTKFYAQAAMLHLLMCRISPETRWADRLAELFQEYPRIKISDMGFPDNWQLRPLWTFRG